MELCKKCVVPLDLSMEKYLPPNALPFHKDEQLCDACYNLKNDPNYVNYFGRENIFRKELDDFLSHRKRIIFAYSGGLDSTIVLDKLNFECKSRGIELYCFTVDYGFKGSKAWDNIKNVISFEGLKDHHEIIDIKNKKLQSGETVISYYCNFFDNGVLPCGINCNRILESVYKEVLKEFNENILVTGGDTPIFNKKLSRYSIFAEKDGYTILRGAVGFGLNKKENRDYIAKNKIPWTDPKYGGYDTDCLLPGAILRKNLEKSTFEQDKIGWVVKNFPVVLDYLAPRVRWGIIRREDAIEMLNKLDIGDEASYAEIERIKEKIAQNEI